LWNEQWVTHDAGDKELASVTDVFEKGQAAIVEVLSTQDSLIQELQNYLALLNEIAQAAADMVSALAIDPECLIK
jgi:outer membrane protein TolC